MRTVHKYPLKMPGQGADTFTVDLPAGAQILTVQLQRGEPMLWALVETDYPTQAHMIRIVGTGHPLAEDGHHDYLGTVQFGGQWVFHYFEMVPF